MRSILGALTTFGPPVTIVTALMLYFGWARSQRQAQAMGVDVSLFGYSTQDYVLRSISTLYIPMVVTAAGALGWLAVHRRVKEQLAGGSARRRLLKRAGLAALAAGLLASLTAVLVHLVDPNRWPLVIPLALAVGA